MIHGVQRPSVCAGSLFYSQVEDYLKKAELSNQHSERGAQAHGIQGARADVGTYVEPQNLYEGHFKPRTFAIRQMQKEIFPELLLPD